MHVNQHQLFLGLLFYGKTKRQWLQLKHLVVKFQAESEHLVVKAASKGFQNYRSQGLRDATFNKLVQ